LPLTPGPPLPSLPPDEAGFEYRHEQHEPYAAYAAITLRDAACALDEQNAVVQRTATRVRSRLATDSPAELAARYTDDPFPPGSDPSRSASPPYRRSHGRWPIS
jgi:hypothetical protein